MVADPFAGSGMTGVAALLSGRSAVLSDLSPGAVHLARNHTRRVEPQRLREAVAELDRRWMHQVEQDLYQTTITPDISGLARHTIGLRPTRAQRVGSRLSSGKYPSRMPRFPGRSPALDVGPGSIAPRFVRRALEQCTSSSSRTGVASSWEVPLPTRHRLGSTRSVVGGFATGCRTPRSKRTGRCTFGRLCIFVVSDRSLTSLPRGRSWSLAACGMR